ncbi:hypothetical protein BaRGS_00001207 [Batillaria attramentaria]|uniref:Uncharacterized protein n=1 Tax=Batillaria attramentaria TaxID=370345 RepID=A0ABD0M6I7_9CAEN
MGGCYSSASHKALTSPRHKQPQNGSLQQNGKSPGNASITDRNSNTNRVRVPCKDALPEEHHTKPAVSPEEVVPSVFANDGEKVKGVAPSDSGIESIGSPQEESAQEPVNHEFSLCQSCHQKLQRISRGSCHQCGNFRINSSELSALVSGDTYCTCGPRVAGRQSACRTHGLKGGNAPTHRHSDMLGLVLKSNLKKHGSGRGDAKRVRMSWKSADSLDMGATMNTCMDRAKSEASEIFGDDVSFRAPLAQFDSVDCQLDADDGVEANTVFAGSRMSIYSEILDLADCICKCDFSSNPEQQLTAASTSVSDGQESQCVQVTNTCRLTASPVRLRPDVGSRAETNEEKEDDDDSGHGVSKSEERSESVVDSDLDTGEESDRLLSSQSSPARQVGLSWFDSSLDWSEMMDSGVCPVTVKGHKMVMMDAGTYTQMLSDLALLKEQLSHLTQVIQEEEGLQPLDLSFPLNY